MRDLMMEIYEALNADELLAEHIENIKFFDYPNANEINEPIIVIDDLTTPIPSDFADNNNMSYQYLFQVDLFIKNDSSTNSRLLSNKLVIRIMEIMWSMGFHVSMSGKPDYLKDFDLYRSSLSFTGKFYKD